MLTSRPFDEVVERSRTRSLDATPVGNGGGDKLVIHKLVIQGYAQRYLKEIVAMLDIVPRHMLLIFKMNDCLRHVDMALGSPANNLVVAGRYASWRVFESERNKRLQSNGGFLCLLRDWFSYMNVLLRVNSYELITRLKVRTTMY
jgi:aarF domain-containing kinase